MLLKRAIVVTALLTIACALLIPTLSAAQTPSSTSSLLVKLVDGLSVQEQADVIARNGGVEISSIPALRLHVIQVAPADLPQVLANYQADPQVVNAEENKTRQSQAFPTDPLYPNQWALAKIGWDQVFGAVTPTGSAIVAILDTGIDALHPDLAGNVIPGMSILDGSAGTTDPSGHGTWVAGIVAARTDTAPLEGIAGVAYAGVRVMPVTVLDVNGLGQDSDVIAGVIWAADHGADVIVMAFSSPGFSQNLQDAIDYAWSKNVVLVAATGNDALNTPTFPAGDRGVMGVSGTDPSDTLVPFSSYGPSAFIAAPATEIQTTTTGDAYTVISGTSASAAIVAGAAAFMKAVDPTLTNGIIVGRLARMADPAGTQDQTGNGRINMARALADTGTDFVQPAGAPPVGDGGPFVGPYVAAASTLASVSVGSQNGALTFGTGGSATYVVTVNRTGSGGLDVSLSITTLLPAGATAILNPPKVTFTGGTPSSMTSTLTITTSSSTPAGTTSFTVKACDSGNPACPGSPTVVTATGSLLVGKANQTITFGALAGKTFGDADFTVSATASSGLTATFTASGGCTVSGTTVHITGAGSCTITAHQSGDSNYNAAADVPGSFTIAPKAASVTPNAASKAYGAADPSPLTTGTLTGFLAADGVTASYSRTTGETVGGSLYTI